MRNAKAHVCPALLAILLGCGTSAAAATADDSFLTYATRRTPGGGSPGGVVTLVDAFGAGDFEIRRVADVQVPVDRDGHGIVDPRTNLMRYRIRPDRGSVGHVRRIGVEVHDFLGVHFFNTRRPEYLLVPASLDETGFLPAPDADQHEVDHHLCYSVAPTAGSAPLLRAEVEASDRFQTRRLRVVRARHLCLPVDKNGEGVRNPARLLTCYRIRRLDRGAQHVSRRIYVTDQLGSLRRRTVVENQLCVPGTSPLIGPAPSPPAPPTPTPAATPSPGVPPTPTPSPTPQPTPTATATPAPTASSFVDFSGVYRGTAHEFDGQDDAPVGRPRDATLTISQADGTLTVQFDPTPGSCPDTITATVAPGESSFASRADSSSGCRGTAITATLVGDRISGRLTWEDIADPSLHSWTEFEDLDRSAP